MCCDTKNPKSALFLKGIHCSEFLTSWIKAVHQQHLKHIPLQCDAKGLISGQCVWEEDQNL